jgi:DNA end-binding protein Ku
VPRPIWTGHISFGLVEIPVSVVSAVKKDELSFKQLDGRDHAPVGYKRINKRTGEEIPYDEIVKGYELDDAGYVILTKDEIKDAYPKATSTIDIFAFVDLGEIEHAYFDTPYYLIPGGKKKRPKAYALLRETLRETGKVALAKVVLRTRQYLAALLPQDDALVMQTLRYGHELRDVGDLELPGRDLDEQGVSDQERKLADMLVQSLAGSFTPETYRDDYRDKVLAYIEKKAREGDVAARELVEGAGEEAAGDVVDIMELLKKSVEAAKKKAG